MLFIPGVQLFNIMIDILDLINNDIKNNISTPEKSILYYLFNGMKYKDDESLDFYEQAVDLFSKTNDDATKIKVRNYFDAERGTLPTIHLNFPNEQPNNNGIGVDAGYKYPQDWGEGEFSDVFTRSFDSTHYIIVSAGNEEEVTIIYNIIKAFLISNLDIVANSGLINPKLGGGDIQFNSELVPSHIFTKMITLNYSYEFSVPSLLREKILGLIEAQGAILTDEHSSSNIII